MEIKSGSGGFCGLLAIVFIALKLCGVINWSWWWVLAPLWIPFALLIAIAAVLVTIAGVCTLAIKLLEKKR